MFYFTEKYYNSKKNNFITIVIVLYYTVFIREIAIVVQNARFGGKKLFIYQFFFTNKNS